MKTLRPLAIAQANVPNIALGLLVRGADYPSCQHESFVEELRAATKNLDEEVRIMFRDWLKSQPGAKSSGKQ